MLNGWAYEPKITNYEALLFYNSMNRLPDSYDYRPIAIAKREEGGVKYRFFCIAQQKNLYSSPTHFADIEVYKPVRGMPYVTNINRLNFDDLFC